MDYHPIANIFPMLSQEELQNLADDIKEHGLNHPITIYHNQILDGRNRFEACKIANIKPDFREYTGNTPAAFVVSENLKRRHLTQSQAAALSVNALPMLEAEAKKRQGERTDLTSGQSCPDVNRPHRARDDAAKLFGTNPRYVSDAKKLKNEVPDLFNEVASGKMTIPEARKQVRRIEIDKERAEVAKIGRSIPKSDKWNIYHADIANWQAPRQYDFIITDPPYEKEYLPLYEILAIRADEWLKKSGLLLVMCGQSYLDQIYDLMSLHLIYYWSGCYLTPGQPTPLRQKQVNTNWKPILIFSKTNAYNGKIFGDVFKSDANDKSMHKWGQSISGMLSIIRQVCLPGQYVLDPFCGAGTTGIAATKSGCLFDGLDIDEQNVKISRGRLNDTTEE